MDCHREAWKPNEVQDVLQTLRKEVIATPCEQCTYQRLETGRQVCVCVCVLFDILPPHASVLCTYQSSEL